MRLQFFNKTVKRKRKLSTPEYYLHCQMADYLHLALNLPGIFWTSIEVSNHTGGANGAIKQAKDARKGVKAGIPDVLIQFDSHSLWLEIKAGKNKTTKIQDNIHEEIRRAGSPVEVVYSIEQIKAALIKWNIPHRNIEITYSEYNK